MAPAPARRPASLMALVGPADAQSTLMFVPEGRSPDDKVAFGVWVDGELVGLYDKLESEAVLMDKPMAAAG